ncbi:MAG: hypothetical protein OXH36_02175, partial [Bdellovibrionales bacterium]|nr:hypothetical protein [Bdellovibrionales bacterium]
LGISAVFRFSDDTKVEVAFRTFERFSSVLEDYTNKNFNIDLILSTKNSVEKLQLSSVPEDSSREDKVTLEFLVGEQEKAIRTFVLKEGTLRDIFNNNLIKENVSIEIHSENENRQTVSLYRGDLISRHFTSEEIEQLNTALLDIEKEKINKKKERALDRLLIRIQTGAEQTVEEHNSLAEKTSLLSDKEIKSTAQAMRIFLFDFSTLVNTEYFKVTLWSYFAMFRQFLTFPRSFGTLALFSNYFNRVYTESHVPTFFNGGYQIRFIESIKKIFPSGREYLSSLKDFETKMIPIERQYIRAATEYTYLVALKRFMIGEDSLDSLIAAGVQKHENKKSEFLPKDDITDRSNFSLDDAGKKAAFLEFFQTVLFEESMRDYLREVLAIEEGQKMTDRNILSVLKNKLKQGESLHLPRESLNDVRDRVKKMANEHNLEQDTNNTMDRFYRAFFKKYSIKRKKQMQNLLSPNTNSFMQRIYVVDSMSKDPEAMSRITRSEFTKLLIDKPIELAILLLLMSGATDGILKVLHAEPFGEQSVFYFSTYIIWAVFMVKFVLEFFADSWLKIQVDANRGLREDVENFLKKEDIEKRFAALKWFWKSSKEKGNEYMEYYKFLWKVVHSNIRPAIVLMGMAFVSTMGRFDIELLIGVLLVEALLGVGALKYKMDGSYEKFKSYALKDLIKRNIDVKKFLTHPFVQQIFIDESFKYRLKFNFWNALLVNNPLENISRLVESSGALSGSRAFYRAFTPSHNSITGGYLDRAVELASQAEDHLINFCKKAFTRNRMDTFD